MSAAAVVLAAVIAVLVLAAVWDSPMVRSLRTRRRMRKGRGRDAS